MESREYQNNEKISKFSEQKNEDLSNVDSVGEAIAPVIVEVKNNDKTNLPVKQKDREGKFKFYYDRNRTEKTPYILSEKEKKEMSEVLEKYREIKESYRNALSKNPELVKETGKAKERIINLGKRLGLNLDGRLIENDEIHLIPEEYFVEFSEGDKSRKGAMFINEIGIKTNTDGKDFGKDLIMSFIQHELIHSATTRKIFLQENNVKIFALGYYNYSISKDYNRFQEGLTELTNHQLFLEENEIAPEISYAEEVILITELAKDIFQKTRKPVGDTLAELQTGMFEGEARYLKIISDVYGQEGLNKIRKMHNRGDALKAAQDLGLQKAVHKIEDLKEGIKVKIDISGNQYPVGGRDLSVKEYLSRILLGLKQKAQIKK